ncbi:MAG: hypothetical protein WKF97_21950 [Chitinophagaceae bacterium]
MWSRKTVAFPFICCIICFHATAQHIESNSERERIFAFEVKHIDEFFERFNDEPDAFINAYVKDNYPGITVDRGSLISNLFNKQNKNWNENEVADFYNQVTDSVNPVFLDFISEHWYAEALCKFEYNGKMIDVVILLKIQHDADGGSKWTIAGAYSRFITPVKYPIAFQHEYRGIKFLNPMSHATNFLSLSSALRDKPNIRDYLDTNFIHYPASRAFLRAVLNNQLKYRFVKNVVYHFLQVDGWIFTISRFSRPSVNSGWLISNLKKASDREKDAYVLRLLHAQ